MFIEILAVVVLIIGILFVLTDKVTIKWTYDGDPHEIVIFKENKDE